jgi:hypothetical protein
MHRVRFSVVAGFAPRLQALQVGFLAIHKEDDPLEDLRELTTYGIEPAAAAAASPAAVPLARGGSAEQGPGAEQPGGDAEGGAPQQGGGEEAEVGGRVGGGAGTGGGTGVGGIRRAGSGSTAAAKDPLPLSIFRLAARLMPALEVLRHSFVYSG